ncbi:hypothetical protein C8J25_101845 [Sphingomonas faeni]|uniref:Uncharacterized protein n=1 Tax=Sphingomonas faeni TaxID=185950 RepID=A0A2T5UCV3_9SPHN|nr:hypothetical protein [Sphingomonas faeni]PTW49337.1 hypothetical protein C8J25_101845 [Sphingomonas faeni]
MTYANRSLSTPFADDLPPPPITMGRDVGIGSVTPITVANDSTAILSNEGIYRAFVELAQNDPSYLQRLAAKFDYRAPFKQSAPIVALPISKLKTVEVGIDDKGAPKPPKGKQRVREDRAALRFSCTIQITTPKSSQISLPCWTGRAQFRSPARMLKDARDMLKDKRIGQTYHDWLVSDIIPLATAHDMMIGCLRIGTEGEGTPFSDRQVIMADRVGLEAHELDSAMLVSNAAGKQVVAKLPHFDKLTSKGNALGGGFVMQSRGSRGGDKLDWRTGDIKVDA